MIKMITKVNHKLSEEKLKKKLKNIFYMHLMGTELMNQSVGAVRAVPLNFYIITYDLSAFLCSSNNKRKKYKN